MIDFLFRSEYQKQLVDILGQLPSTSVFFSVDDYLFARLSVLNVLERKLLFFFIFQLQKRGFLTDFYQAAVISTSELGLDITHLDIYTLRVLPKLNAFLRFNFMY